jgi:hypothetical protein
MMMTTTMTKSNTMGWGMAHRRSPTGGESNRASALALHSTSGEIAAQAGVKKREIEGNVYVPCCMSLKQSCFDDSLCTSFFMHLTLRRMSRSSSISSCSTPGTTVVCGVGSAHAPSPRFSFLRSLLRRLDVVLSCSSRSASLP